MKRLDSLVGWLAVFGWVDRLFGRRGGSGAAVGAVLEARGDVVGGLSGGVSGGACEAAGGGVKAAKTVVRRKRRRRNYEGERLARLARGVFEPDVRILGGKSLVEPHRLERVYLDGRREPVTAKLICVEENVIRMRLQMWALRARRKAEALALKGEGGDDLG